MDPRDTLRRIKENQAAIEEKESRGEDPDDLYRIWSELHIEALQYCWGTVAQFEMSKELGIGDPDESDQRAQEGEALAAYLVEMKDILTQCGIWHAAATE